MKRNKTDQKLHIVERKSSPKKLRSHELVVHLTNTDCGRDFTFALKGSHLEVVPDSRVRVRNSGYSEASEDWYEALTEPEILEVMQMVASYYRRSSLDVDGMKTAALGVTEDTTRPVGHSRRHLIYVGVNTNCKSSNVNKDCAEQNMLSAASASLSRYQHDHPNGEKDSPQGPKFKAVYVMGGRDANPSPENPNDKGVSMICPCGLCTDTLAQHMLPNGLVYAIPHTKFSKDASQQPKFEMDTRSKHFFDIKPDTIWRTSIEVLNQHRVKSLSEPLAQSQRDSLDAIVDALADYKPPVKTPEVIGKAGENEARDRISIARLDVATHQGKADLKEFSHFMFDQIVKALHSRAIEEKVGQDKEAIRAWLTNPKKIQSVRTCVVQLDDGTYHMGIDPITRKDRAFSTPEMAAVDNASHSLGHNGIQRMWGMEFNPVTIEKGLMVTATKDGLERVLKRPSKTGAEFTDTEMPLNFGQLGPHRYAEIRKQHCYTKPEIFPGGFLGSSLTQSAAAGAVQWQYKVVNRSPGFLSI